MAYNRYNAKQYKMTLSSKYTDNKLVKSFFAPDKETAMKIAEDRYKHLPLPSLRFLVGIQNISLNASEDIALTFPPFSDINVELEEILIEK